MSDEKRRKEKNTETKAGLMSKDDQNEKTKTDAVNQKTIDEKLPKTGKHNIERDHQREGLH